MSRLVDQFRHQGSQRDVLLFYLNDRHDPSVHTSASGYSSTIACRQMAVFIGRMREQSNGRCDDEDGAWGIRPGRSRSTRLAQHCLR